MNDLLFYLIIIALLYYFFIYLPKQKQLESTKPTTQHQGTQTTPIIDDPELEQVLDNLLKNIHQLNQQLK
jgi:hypothetical protein